MGKRNRKHSSVVTVVFLSVSLIIGVILGLSIVEAFGGELSWWQLAGRLLEGVFLILFAFVAQVVIHEAGHMVAGILRGWSFMSFMILGFVVSRREGRFHWSRFAIPGVGGQCLMIPPKEGDTDFGIAFYNAGGVLLNLFVMLVSICLFAVGHASFPWAVNVLLVSLSCLGLLFALINGIPSSQSGIPNDGKNIVNLRRDSFSTHVFLATMQIMGKLQQGCSVDKVMDGYLTDGVEIDFSNPIHVMAANFDVSLAVARFDFDKAHSFFKKIDAESSKIVSIYRKEFLYEKVFLNLVDPRDGVDVGFLIDSDTLKYFEMQTLFRPTALRVKYAFARLYECDEAKAAIIYQQFQKACQKYHVQGEVLSEKKLVEYVRTLQPIDD